MVRYGVEEAIISSEREVVVSLFGGAEKTDNTIPLPETLPKSSVQKDTLFLLKLVLLKLALKE
jgi:hypothetical protein